MTVRSPDTTPPSTTRCPTDDPAPVDTVPPDASSVPSPSAALVVSENAPPDSRRVAAAAIDVDPDIVPPAAASTTPPVTCNVAPALWLNGTAITPVLPAVADIDDVAVFVNVGVPPIPVISGS